MSLSNEVENRIGKSIKLDAEGDAHFGTISYLHDKIHEGKMLYSSKVFTVADAGVVYLHNVMGPTKYFHGTIKVDSVGEWRFTSYSGTTYNDPGDELQSINRKSDSTNVPEVKIYENALGDIDVLGTQRLDFVFGSGTNPAKATSGTFDERLETVFQPDLDILVKLTNNSGSEQLLTVIYDYYEEE